ncbi:GAF domain-containing protein [Saccharothrix violaceirubra]|uniref:ANTAR domain-containing protein n=1 Tax=Saccharothrix violaceirubra TaxID=413306 RepID=A0A7W7T2D8_9PSEU|nr:GAF and ANTAR domain-containing protein [Saccharothrix violaceirubra]MBB4964976.1 hypothetical protein [Saccharothrix violaceirubra]
MDERGDGRELSALVQAAFLAAANGDPPGIGHDPLRLLCRTCVELLPVDGASISVMTGAAEWETLYAGDEVLARAEAFQFTLGEGPCLEAFEHRRPVLLPDFGVDAARRWPVFAAQVAAEPIGGFFAFPLLSGALGIGVMALYRHHTGWLAPAELAVALHLVAMATGVVLGMRLDRLDADWWAALPLHREQVHQATGMLIAAFGIPPDEAFARLRAHAFATGRLVEEIARDLVVRRITPADLDR